MLCPHRAADFTVWRPVLYKNRNHGGKEMLNQRQLEILLELMENDGQYMVASHFTKNTA